MVLQGAEVAQKVEKIKDELKEVQKDVKASIDIKTDQAVSSISRVKSQVSDLSTRLQSIQIKGGLAASGLGAIGSIGQEVTAKVSAGFTSVGGAINEVASRAKSGASQIKGNWKDIESQLQKVAAITTAFAVASIYVAASVQGNLEAIAGTRGEAVAKAYEPWIRAGRGVKYSSEAERGQLAEMAAKHLRTVSVKDQQTFLSLLEKEAVREGKSPGDLGGVMEALAVGRVQMIKREMPGLGIDVNKIQDDAKKMMENPLYMRAHPGATEEDIATEMFVKEMTKWGTETEIPGIGKTLEQMEVSLNAMQRVKSNVSDILSQIGVHLLPVLCTIGESLERINEFFQARPEAAQFSAFVLVLISSTRVISLLSTVFGFMRIGLIGMQAGALGLAGGIGALRIALTAFALSNPILAALLILGTLLIIIDQRTNFLHGTWQRIEQIGLRGFLAETISPILAFFGDPAKLLIGLKLALFGPVAAAIPLVLKVLAAIDNFGESSSSTLKFVHDIMRDILRLFTPVAADVKRISEGIVGLKQWAEGLGGGGKQPPEGKDEGKAQVGPSPGGSPAQGSGIISGEMADQVGPGAGVVVAAGLQRGGVLAVPTGAVTAQSMEMDLGNLKFKNRFTGAAVYGFELQGSPALWAQVLSGMWLPAQDWRSGQPVQILPEEAEKILANLRQEARVYGAIEELKATEQGAVGEKTEEIVAGVGVDVADLVREETASVIREMRAAERGELPPGMDVDVDVAVVRPATVDVEERVPLAQLEKRPGAIARALQNLNTFYQSQGEARGFKESARGRPFPPLRPLLLPTLALTLALAAAAAGGAGDDEGRNRQHLRSNDVENKRKTPRSTFS